VTHFIPDRRFALVRACCGLINVYDVVGFRYDPATDTSQPVVITRLKGAHTFHAIESDPYMLWDRRRARVSGWHMTIEKSQLDQEAIDRINEHERQCSTAPWLVERTA
jgi:hypothetical protein